MKITEKPLNTWMNIQPESIEIKLCDGLFVKTIAIKHKHTLVPQHSHTYDHLSMLAVGSIRIWKDGSCLGDFIAPHGIVIEKLTKHTFLSLEDNTLIYCIHNLRDAEAVSIDDEHQLEGIT